MQKARGVRRVSRRIGGFRASRRREKRRFCAPAGIPARGSASAAVIA